jgi:hypothetical protein
MELYQHRGSGCVATLLAGPQWCVLARALDKASPASVTVPLSGSGRGSDSDAELHHDGPAARVRALAAGIVRSPQQTPH